MKKILLFSLLLLPLWLCVIACSSDRKSGEGVLTEKDSLLYKDPASDSKYPTENRIFSVPVKDGSLWVKYLMAAGAEKKPTVLFLHGNPGNEKQEDIAQALRRAGFNTVLFSYSGSWGNPGVFSLKNAIEDTQSVLDYLLEHAVDSRIDKAQVFLVGHSMGGDVAALLPALKTGSIRGIALLDVWNAYHTLSTMDQAMKEKYQENLSQRPCVNIVSPENYVSEILDDPDLDINQHLAALNVEKVFIFSSPLEKNKLKATYSALNKEECYVLNASDHSFSDKRIELGNCLYSWLLDRVGGALE